MRADPTSTLRRRPRILSSGSAYREGCRPKHTWWWRWPRSTTATAAGTRRSSRLVSQFMKVRRERERKRERRTGSIELFTFPRTEDQELQYFLASFVKLHDAFHMSCYSDDTFCLRNFMCFVVVLLHTHVLYLCVAFGINTAGNLRFCHS